MVRISVKHSPSARVISHVIYNWTDAQQTGIFLLISHFIISYRASLFPVRSCSTGFSNLTLQQYKNNDVNEKYLFQLNIT